MSLENDDIKNSSKTNIEIMNGNDDAYARNH